MIAENRPELVGFAEKLLALLDQGQFTATYKYAVLLGLIDVCLEQRDATSMPPASTEVNALAATVIALYWPQTRPFVRDSGSSTLRQNAGSQAKIVQFIDNFRSASDGNRSIPLSQMRRDEPETTPPPWVPAAPRGVSRFARVTEPTCYIRLSSGC